MPHTKYAYYVCLWSLLCELDQLNITSMILFSHSQILTANARIPNSFHLLKSVRFQTYMRWSSCNDYAQSQKDLTTIITEYSKGDQLLVNILLALSFLILHRLKFLTLKHFQIPFSQSLLNKSCLLTDYVNMVLPELSLYFQLSLSNQSLVNLRLSSTIV